MTKATVDISVETGVHARPAAMFVKLANQYPCEIKVEKDEKVINGKSIMGLMMLALTKGTTITIKADGQKEKEAVESLVDLIESDFDRDDLL